MAKQLAKAATELPEQAIVEIASFATHFKDVIPLWFGESDIPTPEFIIRSAHDAAISGDTFYPDVLGTPDLREEIARYSSRNHGTPVSPASVLVTASGMEALTLALRALLESGDEAIIVRPAWQNVVAATEMTGATVREVHLSIRADGKWHLPLDDIRAAITDRTKCILVNSPNNPTGWMARSETIKELVELSRTHGTWLICDEVYERLVFDRDIATSALEHRTDSDRILVVNSFSKTWAMTGWRLGWLIGPSSAIPALGRVKEYGSSGTNPFLQAGALAALREGEDFVSEFRRYCANGRDIVRQHLMTIDGVTAPEPQSAIYQVFRVDSVPGGIETSKRLVSEFGVGIAPCDMFGGGLDQWFRICFAQSPEKLDAGMTRLVQGLTEIQRAARKVPNNQNRLKIQQELNT